MRLLLFIALIYFDNQACAQNSNASRRLLYFTQIKAAEALLRLNEVGEAKRVLEQANVSLRRWEWQLLNAMSDRSVQTLNGHRLAATAIAVNKDGSLLASGGADSSIVIWDARSGEKIFALNGHKGQINSLDFHPDGVQLISGSTDRSVKLWNIKERKEIATVRKDFFRSIYQCKFSPDGKNIGIVSWEFVPKSSPPVQGFAAVISLHDGNLLKRFNTDHHPASALDFSNDGNKLYTATWGFHVKQHDIGSGKDDWDYNIEDIGYYAAFQSCDLSPDGLRIVTSGKDNQVRMLDASNGKLLYLIEPHKGHLKWVNSVRFSENGKLFASASDDQLIKVWEAETGRLLHSLKGHTNNVNALAFSPDNKTIFSVSADGTIKKWNIEKTGQYKFFVCKSGPWYTPVDPSGKLLAAACSDSFLNVWNLETRSVVHSFKGVSAITAAINGDGKFLASANNSIEIFNLSSGKLLGSQRKHRSRITGMDWLPSKNYVATASGDGSIGIWDDRGDSITTVLCNSGPVYSVVFAPDSKQMIAGMSNGKIKFYNTSNWSEVDSFQAATSLFNLRIDPTGKYLLVSGDKGSLLLYNIKTKQRRELKGHNNAIYGIAFHPEGDYAVSASYDLSVKIWDMSSADCVLTLRDFKDELYTVSILPASKRLVVSDVAGFIHVLEW